MNFDEAERRIREIAQISVLDNERAHILEDELRADTLLWVSELMAVPLGVRKVVKLVLSSKEIDFERWYA